MNEAQTDREDGIKRREFLELLGAAFAAAGCSPRRPKEAVVPALALAEGSLPGRADWYASTCGACTAACGALVKVRDGRPIKLEGNPDHPFSRGGLCARGQASVLDLYDSRRLRGPRKGDAPAAWGELDAAVMDALRAAGRSGKAVRLLTGTPAGPAERAAAAAFTARHGARHVVYDPVSRSAVLEAHALTHGRRALPRYHFAQARVIVSIAADFLGSWVSPVEFTRDWAANRRPADEWDLMSWHGQFEAMMSLTGANADLRVPLKPSEERGAAALLAGLVADRVGWTGPRAARGDAPPRAAKALRDAADLLAAAKGRALVVSGSSDVAVQVLVNWTNHMLAAYGATLELARPSFQAEGDDASLPRLVSELERGEVAVLVVHGVNPAYDNPHAEAFRAAARKAGLVVTLSGLPDETSALAHWSAPDHHALESWGDAEPGLGVRSLRQPAVAPLYDTRAAAETLLAWSGRPASAYDHVRALWRSEVFARQKAAADFEAFWSEALRRGAVTSPEPGRGEGSFDAGALTRLSPEPAAPEAAAFEPVPYASTMLYDGRQAGNPWLQELPDPVTKACWGNWASLAPEDAARLGVIEGRLVRLRAGALSAVLPAHVQPGQAPGSVVAALGYGRPAAGPVAANYPLEKLLPIEREAGGGADLYPFVGLRSVSVEVLPGMSLLAKSQTYDHLADPLTKKRREHLRETTLQELLSDPRAGNPPEPTAAALWPAHEYKGRKWAMSVDLSLCTGCSACVVACQAENNVPVVGKAEVRKGRDMAWLRLDRYYSGTPGEEVSESGEVETAFQPMLCQHCDNAPCETVCPVLATVHSTEGLNMQVYNRCVGTRYCANNCPYKVRRFNWFDYAHQDQTQNLALNPDVTVRTRGVMEKCSFCVQRIYAASSEAKSEGRALKGSQVRPACAQSCPAQAIVFGDANEAGAPLAEALGDARSFRVLPELGVGPGVHYRTKVRNKKV
ncbi:MAG: 4Fe-4S dicluster domain-containing protein [Elusimicrobia bacterium]|nr:4Fe-4S dicluster domain-containing protein [Elusimicrobiota bacterium]